MTTNERYAFLLTVHSPASDIHHGQQYEYRGTVDRDEVGLSVDVAGSGPQATALIAYRTDLDYDHSGDRLGIASMINVPQGMFNGSETSTFEATGPLVDHGVPHSWKIGGADRTVVIRDAASGRVDRVESYRGSLLVGVRSLIRIPLP